LAKNGIAVAVWQVRPIPRLCCSKELIFRRQFAISDIGRGFDPNVSPSPGGQGPSSNTMCYWIPQVYLPNDIQIRRTV